MTFDVLWRDAAGDHPIVTFTHHFDPPPSGFNAVLYEADAPGVEVKAKPNDLLVLRISVPGTPSGIVYIPNSDGARAQGRIPSLTLPR